MLRGRNLVLVFFIFIFFGSMQINMNFKINNNDKIARDVFTSFILPLAFVMLEILFQSLWDNGKYADKPEKYQLQISRSDKQEEVFEANKNLTGLVDLIRDKNRRGYLYNIFNIKELIKPKKLSEKNFGITLVFGAIAAQTSNLVFAQRDSDRMIFSTFMFMQFAILFWLGRKSKEVEVSENNIVQTMYLNLYGFVIYIFPIPFIVLIPSN